MFLTLLIFLPLMFAILLGFFPERMVRPVSLVLALLHFGYSLLLFRHFDPSKVSFQLVEQAPWLPTYGINYFVGIDGISFWLVLLTTFFTPIVVLASWTSIADRVRSFHVCVFLLATTMLGTFLAPRRGFILHVLRSVFDSNVFDDRDLGRLASPLCDDEVLHLHVFRIALYVGRVDHFDLHDPRTNGSLERKLA